MSDDRVRLKPIMGIRPGVYLAFIYGIILLLILFFILIYPGIRNPGSLLVVKSEPWGAAVLVDGVYMDSAPAEIFVARGRRHIELSLPGFQSTHIERDIGGRLLASSFFPSRVNIHEKLVSNIPYEAFIYEAAEFAAWTFAGEPSASYQIPLSLSEAAYRLGASAASREDIESMEDTLAAAARFAVTKASLRDLIRAKTLLDNQGLSPSPISLLGSVQDIISYLNKNPMAALWLTDVLEGDALSSLAASEWYLNSVSFEIQNVPVSRSGGLIHLGNLNFKRVDGSLPLLGVNFPPGTEVESFFISETLISVTAWEAFLSQQPHWRKDNLKELMAQGLVTDDYLDPVSGAPAAGVSGISWYAALAFCQWLNEQVQSLPQFYSWELRLPSEEEWEYAARSGVVDYGHFWEWCNNPYAPLSFLSAAPNAITNLGSPERVLRGGSWVNSLGLAGIETRASLPPDFSSPFVSFRPVIAPKRQ